MKYNVYGIGNALVDMEFKVSDQFLTENSVEKGHMTLVDEARQAELTESLHKLNSDEIKRQCGGSAANTIIAVSQFGGKSFYSCKVANDTLGKFYLGDLKENSVDTKLTPETAKDGTTGKCMVMVSDDAERTMNTYLGITETFSVEELDEEALKNSEWLYIEGYLVTGPTGQNAALEAKKLAQKHGVKTSLTMSDPNMVKFFRENMLAIIGDGLDLLFCNEDEAKELTGKSEITEAREELKKYAKSFAITLGEKGAVAWDGSSFIEIAPNAVDAIDTNGAGDMFAGAFLYGITNGHDFAGAGAIASRSSSKVVSQFGPRLSIDQVKEVKNA